MLHASAECQEEWTEWHIERLYVQDNPGELLRAARAVAAEAYDRDTLMKARALVCLMLPCCCNFQWLAAGSATHG